jgi:competence protein ComEA
MTRTQTASFDLRRFYRRAITVSALALFAITAAATLAAPRSAGAGVPAAPAAVAAIPAATVAADARPAPAAAADGEADKKPSKKASKGKAVTGVLNLNTATEEQLQMLPGVGPAKAERVVAYRNQRGKFQRVQDLRRVKGFGYKTLKKLEPHLTVTGPTTLQPAAD